MTPYTSKQLADLYAKAFPNSRAWSEAEILGFLNDPKFHFESQTNGFGLVQIIGDEAELLTLVTDPAHQRKGIGWAILTALIATAKQNRATQMFLEVSVENRGAIQLYQRLGFAEIGRRKAYYRRSDGAVADALVLRIGLEDQNDTQVNNGIAQT